MIYWIIAAVIWIIGIFVAYFTVISKWDGKSQAEKIYYSIIWPLLLLLYPIHWIYNSTRDKN